MRCNARNPQFTRQRRICLCCHASPIDRKRWRKHAGAQKCINGEAQGLISHGAWDYTKVAPRENLLARKEPLNIGRLMTLLSIKNFEVPELRKLKARIVFRGDGIRDESDNLSIH